MSPEIDYCTTCDAVAMDICYAEHMVEGKPRSFTASSPELAEALFELFTQAFPEDESPIPEDKETMLLCGLTEAQFRAQMDEICEFVPTDPGFYGGIGLGLGLEVGEDTQETIAGHEEGTGPQFPGTDAASAIPILDVLECARGRHFSTAAPAPAHALSLEPTIPSTPVAPPYSPAPTPQGSPVLSPVSTLTKVLAPEPPRTTTSQDKPKAPIHLKLTLKSPPPDTNATTSPSPTNPEDKPARPVRLIITHKNARADPAPTQDPHAAHIEEVDQMQIRAYRALKKIEAGVSTLSLGRRHARVWDKAIVMLQNRIIRWEVEKQEGEVDLVKARVVVEGLEAFVEDMNREMAEGTWRG
ncbi:hypothetical protein BDW74DRAFT_175216 [Aspergillus multicolor]|uniref:uncharacterized protein n=1 Tax=Aspergillus multicolor TaxID=41759 RepID=UPI003CCDAFA9